MQEQRFLLITSFLVVLIGAPAVYSVVQEPEEMRIVQNIESTTSQSGEQRSPASIKEDPEHRNAIKSKSVTLDYSCKKDKAYEVDGTLLRLRGSSCINPNWKDLTVVNQTNGFTASIIFTKNQNFTTDFIDLQEGDNHLSIQGKDEKGQPVIRNFLVKRRFPASDDSNQR